MSLHNLNQLNYLKILIEEKHVSRAAQKAGITQPAMSHVLKDLRRLLKDPILVPGIHGYTPTEKAVKIYQSLSEAFHILDGALADDIFDPALHHHHFKVMMTDYAGVMLMPQLAQLLEKSPNIQIEVYPWTAIEVLPGKPFDLAIGFEALPNLPGITVETLFTEHYICLCRQAHPRLNDTITLEEFLAEDHIIVREQDGAIGVVNSALKKLGLEHQRKIKLEVPNFLLFPFIVAQTDMIITTTSRNAALFIDKLPLRTVPVPLEIPPVNVQLYYPSRMATQPAYQWLISAIRKLGRDIAKPSHSGINKINTT